MQMFRLHTISIPLDDICLFFSGLFSSIILKYIVCRIWSQGRYSPFRFLFDLWFIQPYLSSLFVSDFSSSKLSMLYQAANNDGYNCYLHGLLSSNWLSWSNCLLHFWLSISICGFLKHQHLLSIRYSVLLAFICFNQYYHYNHHCPFLYMVLWIMCMVFIVRRLVDKK